MSASKQRMWWQFWQCICIITRRMRCFTQPPRHARSTTCPLAPLPCPALQSSLAKTHEVVDISLAQMDALCGNALELEDGRGLPVMAMSTQVRTCPVGVQAAPAGPHWQLARMHAYV